MITTGISLEAIRAIRANKLRALLSTLGVAIGCACVVLVVTVSLSANTYITGLIESIGTNLVYAELIPGRSMPPLADLITPADMQVIQQDVPQVVHVAGSNGITVGVVAGTAELPVTLLGVTDGYQEIRRLVVLRGRYFDQSDSDLHSKVCLITEELAARAFPADDPVGRTMRAGDLTFSVIGVFRERGTTFGESDIRPLTMLVPFSAFRAYSPSDFVLMLYAQAKSAEDVPQVTNEIAHLIRSRHRAGAKYDVQNLRSLLNAARKISLGLSITLIVIGLITLTIGGVNIMNIMLVTVTERTREIGIRKAVGARRDDIRQQFLLEAVLISSVGAVAGIIVGIGVPELAEPFLPGNFSVRFAWLSVLIAFVVSSSIGILFGYLPANQAAKLQPTEALRHE
jgi:putative ABC transport system permease protein